MARCRRVALLVESSRAYGRGLLHGIAEYVRLHGAWSIYLAERGLGDAPPAWMKGWAGDGVIARVENRKIGQAIRNLGIAAVDLRGLLADVGMPLITTDDEEVVRLAVEHLLDRGFRQFAFCGFEGADYSDRRSAIFTRRIAEAGFACHVYRPSERLGAGGTEARERRGLVSEEEVAQWAQSLPKPIGLMTCNDIRGQQVLNACREVGIAVPDEIAVIGVDNDDVLCDLSDPPLSSIIPDTHRIGYEAAALLDALMDGQPPPRDPICVPPLGVAARRSTDVLAVEDRVMAGVIRAIREHACEGVTIEEILAGSPLSRSTFERRFLRLFGCSPKAEINRVRLEKAKNLLAETEYPLKQVASRSGFKYAEYLSVVFKEKTGQTPGQYRVLARRRKQFAQDDPAQGRSPA